MKSNHGKWAAANKEDTANDQSWLVNANRRKGPQAVSLPEGIGNAEYVMATKTREDAINKMSKTAYMAVSDERREYLNSVINKKYASVGEVLTAEASGNVSLIKQASSINPNPFHIAGTSNSTHLAPNLYSPLFLTANLQLPRDRITANAWNRAFFETNPIVRNAINMHATYPISKMTIRCADKKREQFYLDMAESTDLFSVVQHISSELWKIGECFPYASFDESTGMWDKIYIHNPDYIVVKSTPVPGQSIIALKPDPQLRKIVEGKEPMYERLRAELDPRIIDAVARNKYIPLDSFNVSHLKMLSSPYDVHGTSIIVSVWKDLVLWDLYRENKFVQAESMVNPLTLVKVGNSNVEGHYPRQEEISAMRDVFEQAQFDKDFKIFTHPDVSVERIGFSGGVLDVSSDMNFILDNIFIGLMVPKSIVTQEGASYASASVGLDVMRQRYNNFRTMITNWLRAKIFAPIAEVNEFYTYDNGKKRLVLPEIEWNQMTLYDVDTYIQHLTGLMDKAPSNAPAGVSRTTVYRSLGLDFEDEMANQKKEAIRMAILAKEMQEIQNMTLSELRSMDPDKPITEKIEEPLPGTQSMDPGGGGSVGDMLGGAPPDMSGGGAMPGGDLGGLPGGGAPPTPPLS